MDENLQKFLLKQNEIEKEMRTIYKIMEKFEKSEKTSIKNFYDNKEKFQVLIEYSKRYNTFDYIEYQYYYDQIKTLNDTNKKVIISLLDGFILSLQEFNFQLNLFVNTYIENILNYEMTEYFLDKKELDLDTKEISIKLGEIDEISKKKFVEKKLFELVGIKNFKGTLNTTLKGTLDIKLSPFYFSLTKGKLNCLEDYSKYLFFRQLYFRYLRYISVEGKFDDNNIVDINYQDYAQEFLLGGNLEAYMEFVKFFYQVIHAYPLTGNSLIVIRSIFSFFNLFYKLDGNIDIFQIENILKQGYINDEMRDFLENTIKISKEISDIVYKFTYSKEIESFKSKNDLSDEEYELFKKLRFTSLFLNGNTIFYVLEELRKSGLRAKLDKDEYFNILLDYAISVSSVYGSYRDFIISDLKDLDKKIKSIDISGLSKLFLSDIKYIERDISRLLKIKKKK